MEIVDQIRQTASIVEIASQYTTLKRRGNKHVGLCPFHSEKAPSFTVDDEKQLFHCFGCAAGGDIFTLVMEKENLSFPEALKYLAEKYNIPLPKKREFSPQLQKLEEKLFKINENTLAFFKKNQVFEAVFSGKIDPRIIYKSEELSRALPLLLKKGENLTPTALIQTAIHVFSTQGIAIKDPTPYIASAFCEEGVLTEAKPSQNTEEEILFGWDIAKKLADLDIGQSVIIKGKAIVAVEGMEGTDEAIKRAGELAGKGIVVVKVSRSSQDPPRARASPR